jgi:hypothetical protein
LANRLRYALLCEDIEQERLFRPLLEEVLHRRIHVEPRKPNGGFTFVLGNLKKAALYIRRYHKESVGLLVVVDGDRDGYRERLARVREVLHEAGFQNEKPDRIAICIPTRNVETWELWLCGVSDLNETTDYKSRYQQEFRPQVRKGELVEKWLNTPLGRLEEEARCLPALVHGRAEIERLRRSSSD